MIFMFLGDISPNTSFKQRFLKKLHSFLKISLELLKVVKRLIHHWKAYHPTSPNQKKNLKNTAPFPRYRDSCKNKSH